MHEQEREATLRMRRWAIAGVVAAGLLIPAACGNDGGHQDGSATAEASAQPTAANDCAGTRAIEQTKNTKHRMVAEGIPSIGAATTPEEAREAAWDVLTVVGTDPEILAGYSKVFLNEDVDAVALYSEDGKCLSPKGEELFGGIVAVFAKSNITPSEAPADGVNSGVSAEGTVVVAAHEGISGDRKAILIETEDGTKVWVMKRCGNYVTRGQDVPEGMPKGPTDEPETPGESVPEKHDDGTLPGDGTPASQDPGTPDTRGPVENGVPGAGRPGDAGVDDTGHAPGETRPTQPQRPTTTQTTLPVENPQPTVVAPTSTVPRETTIPPTDTQPLP